MAELSGSARLGGRRCRTTESMEDVTGRNPADSLRFGLFGNIAQEEGRERAPPCGKATAVHLNNRRFSYAGPLRGGRDTDVALGEDEFDAPALREKHGQHILTPNSSLDKHQAQYREDWPVNWWILVEEVEESVQGHFTKHRSGKVHATLLGELHQVDHHVAELVRQLLSFRLGPVRQALGHLPAPLKELGHLAHLADHGQEQVAGLVELIPVPLVRELRLHPPDVLHGGLGAEGEPLRPGGASVLQLRRGSVHHQ
ncbi:hypothetical protein EYF80_000189 [Liparis tanakae]|uniref:Uncharacterized protein n=1 Tax=Liparis tanakae TaxID=230148 RepID=A0A4Z2JH17_9TELE|nr:hypothetical protein EYF80_000189 [Liparis tanakae]